VTGPNHERFREDSGAYLLGALSDEELQAFEAHLLECPDCRDDVELLRLAADALPRSVEQLAAPDSLRDSLMDVVEREARERAGKPQRRFLGERLRGLSPALSGLRPALAMGALAIGLLGGYGISQLTAEDDERTIAARVDSSRVPMATASLKVSGDGDGGGILRVQGLESLPSTRVYQAWIKRDGSFIPQPTFVVGQDGVGAVAVPDDLSGASAVVVTRERRGGARAPGERPIMTVDL